MCDQCENVDCNGKEEVTIRELLERQAKERQEVILPVMKKLVDKINDHGIQANIDDSAFGIIRLVTDSWDASFDLVEFYEKEMPPAPVEVSNNGSPDPFPVEETKKKIKKTVKKKKLSKKK